MISRPLSSALVVGLGLLSPGAALAQAGPPAPPPPNVSTTIIKGAESMPQAPVVESTLHPGDVSLYFPGVDVREVAKVVLGGMLKLAYEVSPSASGKVTLVTAQPIARTDVLGAFEDALRAANMALIRRGGAYAIAPIAEAQAQASAAGGGAFGFASESIELRFIAAAELKKLLDPVVPGTLSVADPARNVITVTGTAGQRRSIHQLVSQFDVDWLKGMSFALYVPQHLDARLIAPEIEKLLNGQGSPSAGLVRLITMERINGILAISARAQYLDDVKRWIEILDREGESSERRLFVYRVENGRSSDLAKALVAAFGGAGAISTGASGSEAPSTGAGFDIDSSVKSAPVAPPAAGRPATAASPQASSAASATITSDETNNAVLAYATPREYAVIEDALRKLDLAPVQVVIEAAIAEVTLNHNLQYGVQWNFAQGPNQYSLLQNTGAVASPSTTVSGSTAATIGGALRSLSQTKPGLSYLFANGGSITATLDALSGLTTVNVLSAPKMLVLNNHTASLEVGQQVPVVTASSVSTIGANAPQVNSVEYRDTGVILKVTPRVNSGGLVLLDIAQEVSDVVSTSTSSINSPTIEQRKFATSIAIQDGQTIALGGLIKDTHTKSRSGIPLLSAIPILGALAGDQGTSDQRTELVILLTPRVIRTAVDADAITNELRGQIQALKPIAPLNSLRP